MDLGTKPKKEGPFAVSTAKEPEIRYPDFNLSDAVATKFLKECNCKVGDELTGVVDLVVTGVRDDQYGKSVTLQVKDLETHNHTEKDKEDKKDEGDESDDESDEETKTLGYKRPASKKSAPDMSAKALRE